MNEIKQKLAQHVKDYISDNQLLAETNIDLLVDTVLNLTNFPANPEDWLLAVDEMPIVCYLRMSLCTKHSRDMSEYFTEIGIDPDLLEDALNTYSDEEFCTSYNVGLIKSQLHRYDCCFRNFFKCSTGIDEYTLAKVMLMEEHRGSSNEIDYNKEYTCLKLFINLVTETIRKLEASVCKPATKLTTAEVKEYVSDGIEHFVNEIINSNNNELFSHYVPIANSKLLDMFLKVVDFDYTETGLIVHTILRGDLIDEIQYRVIDHDRFKSFNKGFSRVMKLAAEMNRLEFLVQYIDVEELTPYPANLKYSLNGETRFIYDTPEFCDDEEEYYYCLANNSDELILET